jgi:hypothetical protein
MQHELLPEAGAAGGMVDIIQPLLDGLTEAVERDGLKFPISYEVAADDYNFLTGIFHITNGEVTHEPISRYAPGGRLVYPIEITFSDVNGREARITHTGSSTTEKEN